MLVLPIDNFAQKMIIDFKSIADQTEQLSGIGKLTFDSGEMIIDYKSGNSMSVETSTIQKIYFGDISSTKNSTNNLINVYPNPSASEMNIDGLPSGDYIINVYRADGSKVITQKISSSFSTINVSALPSGMYFLVINGFNAKFIKL